MKKEVLYLMILTLVGPFAVFAATMENIDSQEYEFQIQESGRNYGSQYRILEHSKVDLCFYGCQITLLISGQRVWADPNDAVVISNRAVKVNQGVKSGRGW